MTGGTLVPTQIDTEGLGEFDRIARFFAPLVKDTPEALGLKDDAALIDLGREGALAVSVDALVADVHFLASDPADLVARKALRVNLSDIAAMAARPRFYTIASALPKALAGVAAEAWLGGFSEGLARDQEVFGVRLIGGDSVSTPGPATIAVTVFGTVDPALAMRRGGARPGDDIWVSGTIGDGAAGLRVLRGEVSTGDPAADARLVDRYHLPRPRTALGPQLAGLATAGMDVSDGLVQDLGHIAGVSAVAATVDRARVPLSDGVRALLSRGAIGWDDVLAGGDDYELLFTASPERAAAVIRAGEAGDVAVTRIGRVEHVGREAGVVVLDEDGRPVDSVRRGWQHA